MTGDQPGAPQTRRGPIGALLDRFGHLIHELSKFATVGGLAFVVDFILFNYLSSGRDMAPLAAKTISTVIAATVAFLGNRFWTWRHRQRSNPAREYALFFFFNAVGLGIAVACLAISHYGLGAIWPAVFQTPWPTTSPASSSAPAWGHSSGSGRTDGSSSSRREHLPFRQRATTESPGRDEPPIPTRRAQPAQPTA